MSEDETTQLFNTNLSLKEYCVVALLYGCGMRISEVCNLRIQDIESTNSRIKIRQGKGAKDRFTLLPNILLDKLRQYYIEANRPKIISIYKYTNKDCSVCKKYAIDRKLCNG
ncbi:MAG: tyrosine-type recombinase/integrase [Saprospiraceae bacterium]|nr:tyrosine-type recombinase/integrase [Saprospiraceae bacterium]